MATNYCCYVKVRIPKNVTVNITTEKDDCEVEMSSLATASPREIVVNLTGGHSAGVEEQGQGRSVIAYDPPSMHCEDWNK